MCPGVKLLGPMLVLHFLFCWPVSMGCLPPNSRQWKGFFQSGLGRLEGFSAEVIFKQGLQGLGGASWLDHKQRQVSPWGREESAQELKGETCGAGVLSTGTGAQNWRVRQGPLGDTAVPLCGSVISSRFFLQPTFSCVYGHMKTLKPMVILFLPLIFFPPKLYYHMVVMEKDSRITHKVYKNL